MLGQYFPCENPVCSCAQDMPSCVYLDGSLYHLQLPWGSLMYPLLTVQAQEPLFSPRGRCGPALAPCVAVFRPLFPTGYWEFHRETALLAQGRTQSTHLYSPYLCPHRVGKVPCPQFLRDGEARRSSMETSPIPDCC